MKFSYGQPPWTRLANGNRLNTFSKFFASAELTQILTKLDRQIDTNGWLENRGTKFNGSSLEGCLNNYSPTIVSAASPSCFGL